MAFSYDLPKEKIAQRPVYPYDAARLLVLDRSKAEIRETKFSDIAQYLRPGDLLVFNDSKVIPARLFGCLTDTGASVEILLLREEEPAVWIAMAKPIKKLKPGTEITFKDSDGQPVMLAKVTDRVSDKTVRMSFSVLSHSTFNEVIGDLGSMPIPPYIRGGRGDDHDKSDYQSLFAAFDGSVAAPTASLHFTPKLIEQLKSTGIEILTCTLHVGSASFLPLFDKGSDAISTPGKELFMCSQENWSKITTAKSQGRRIVAIGTTVVRALESQSVCPSDDTTETDLFIRPGYKFRVCDAVVTNFHQPNTTHLLLVEALLGKDFLAEAYHFALDSDFRFLSYGDGMLIV